MFFCKQNKKINEQKQIKKKLAKTESKNSDMDIEDMFVSLSFFLF